MRRIFRSVKLPTCLSEASLGFSLVFKKNRAHLKYLCRNRNWKAPGYESARLRLAAAQSEGWNCYSFSLSGPDAYPDGAHARQRPFHTGGRAPHIRFLVPPLSRPEVFRHHHSCFIASFAAYSSPACAPAGIIFSDTRRSRQSIYASLRGYFP